MPKPTALKLRAPRIVQRRILEVLLYNHHCFLNDTDIGPYLPAARFILIVGEIE